ncbi:MAG TPA: DUF2207 domain-containing protein, partial [Thermomicrobiales bacterium]|nr:DUF2207 domain-containing protein [Thermomicrobiales bacterium]
MSEEGSRDANIAKGCLSTFAFLIFVAIFVGSAFTNSTSRDSTDRSSVRWNDYDVTIDVREDGTIHVVENQKVAFRGTFRTGFAEIPMEHLESISNVAVAVEPGPRDLDNNGLIDRDEALMSREPVTSVQISSTSLVGPNEFRAFEDGDVYRIDYGFDPTNQSRPSYSRLEPESRRIVLEYDVSGAIRDYPEAAEPWQQLHWMAISDLVTEIADIDGASVTINLPEDVPAADMAWAPEPDEVSGNQLVWRMGKMGEGDDFDVQVAFPAITSATAPAWQQAADAHDAEIEASANRRSLASLMLLGAGVLVVVGGGLALLYAWYTSVNERVPGLVPDILPEPPEDLPAALVGALVDEQVNPRDIAAAIMDLDARDIVRIEAASAESGAQSQYDITLLQPIETALPYEQV